MTRTIPVWAAAVLSSVGQWLINIGSVQRAYRDAEGLASSYMQDNLNLWYEMYTNRPPWTSRRVIPLGLPAAIGRELARYVFMESSFTVTGEEGGENPRSAWLDEQLQAAAERFKVHLEAGLCLGGVALKPYLEGERVRVGGFWPTQFTPTEVDGTGTVTGGVFRETARTGGQWYTKLERHGFRTLEDGRRVYVVENRAYRSSASGDTGAAVPLSDVPVWAHLSEEVTIEDLERPLFAWFTPPVSNNVDPQSPTGVSVYAGSTAALIRQADEMWEKIAWEFYSGRRKIFTDAVQGIGLSDFGRDLFETGRLSKGGTVFEIFSPEFRDEPLFRGLNDIFKRIEFDVGLAYGSLSNPESIEKTATEISASKQRQRTTIRDMQETFGHTVEGLVYAMDAYATLYQLAPAGGYTLTCDWGDGVLDDPETALKQKASDLQEVSAGLMNPWEYRAKWYDEDEETARANLPGMEAMTEPVQEEIE